MGSGDIKSLRAEHITKRFPGVLACDDISLCVNKGETLAPVGENGAGKTTLMNILMGLYTQDEGKLYINDREVDFKSPGDALALGIGMVHQQYMLVPDLKVWENVAMGMQQELSRGKGSLRRRFRLDEKSVRERIKHISDVYGLSTDPDAYIWQLSVGEQQRVELIKTLCLGARFLILDEPTSALTPQETDELIALLKRMQKDLSIIFISHKLAEVKALCDTMLIMRAGKLVYSGRTADHTAADIAALMTGRKVELNIDRPAKNIGEARLKLEDLYVRGDRGNLALNDLSLEVRSGEILGIAGVSGNGQRELAEAITGLRPIEKGSVTMNGTRLNGMSVGRILSLGMGYIPEERNVEGIAPSMSIRENLVLKDIGTKRFTRGGLINAGSVDRNAADLCREFDVRSAGTNVTAGMLSGGNIRKVILAREISRDPAVLIAVYPFRGLDMGAADFVHRQLLDMRDRGRAILLISEESDEVLDLSDRIAVIFKGTIRRVLEKKEATVRRLGILMAGVQEDEG